MATTTVQIVDRGRGPQLSTSRITVLDVFYYLHWGYDFAFIHEAMPSLSREEFDVIVAYANEHHDDLVEKDRRVEEFHQRKIEEQQTRGGIFASPLTPEQRAQRLQEIINKGRGETNGVADPR